ncbi:MAG: TIGR03067 domain-containing protein [Planctomycetaceae bacterium]|nr:TIGR03067 domain-containing protein [Planctomycetaceae bacterium]
MNGRDFGWTLAVVVAALTLTSVSVRAVDEPDDLKLLAGTWLPKEAILGDNKIDQMVLDKAQVVYEGDKYTIKIGDKEEKGTFLLDPKKLPKTMDIFPTSGDNNGKTLLAVYELAGDKLTICYSLTPTVRPENFEPDSNTLLVVKYERMKP